MQQRNSYICDNCGAEVYFHDNEKIKECSYCGNILAIIEKEILNVGINKIIPFGINEEKALENIKMYYGVKATTMDLNLEKVYLPFYLCSFDMTGYADYNSGSGEAGDWMEIYVDGQVKNYLYPAKDNIGEIIGIPRIDKTKIVDYDPIITQNCKLLIDNMMHHEKTFDLIAAKFLYQCVEEYSNSKFITVHRTSENNKKIDLVLVPFFHFKYEMGCDKYILGRNVGFYLKQDKDCEKKLDLYEIAIGVCITMIFLCIISFFFGFLGLVLLALIWPGCYALMKRKKKLNQIPGKYAITKVAKK